MRKMKLPGSKGYISGLPNSDVERLVQVRPGTWVLRNSDRTDKEIRQHFREIFKGSHYGCSSVSGIHGFGIIEADRISKGASMAGHDFAIQWQDIIDTHFKELNDLIKRIQFIGKTHEIPVHIYIENLIDIKDVDLVMKLRTKTLINDILKFNEIHEIY